MAYFARKPIDYLIHIILMLILWPSPNIRNNHLNGNANEKKVLLGNRGVALFDCQFMNIVTSKIQTW